MTAKIGGKTRPCTARQKISDVRLVERATITVGMTSTNIATMITRLRPRTSVTAPVKGAVSATARVLTVMMVETSAALAPNSFDNSGRIDCGEYRLMKAQYPAIPAARRKANECRAVAAVILGNQAGRLYPSYASVLH